MTQRLLLGDGSEHIVGEPVEDSLAQEAVDEAALDAATLADARAAIEQGLVKPTITPCVTAFTIFIMADGDVLVDYYMDLDLTPERQPTFDEMTFACGIVVHHKNVDLGVDDSTRCITAFTPYLTHDGRWLISADLNDPIQPDRAPTDAEVIGACIVAQRDVQTQEAVNGAASIIIPNVVQQVLQNLPNVMMQFGAAVKQQAEAQKVATQLEKDKKRRGGG